jgi:hypothetical protein
MSVDFPTFGRPAKQANPDLNSVVATAADSLLEADVGSRRDGVPTCRFSPTWVLWP